LKDSRGSAMKRMCMAGLCHKKGENRDAGASY